MRHNILLITYHYPPSMAVGGLRLANFVRYLPENGWQPCVLTIQDRYLDQMDPQRLRGLDHARVYKTVKTPTVSDLYLKLKRLLEPMPNGPSGLQRQLPHPAPKEIRHPAVETMPHRLKRYIFSLLLSLPDGERNWVLPAVARGLGIIRRERIDCILTSCPPHSVHLIGLALKLLTRVHWVADFRDPWITGSKKRLYYTSQLSMKIEDRLEKQVLRRADVVLANTSMLLRKLQQTHGKILSSKFVHIPNGFDPQESSHWRSLGKYRRFTITYAGSLYFGRSPEPVFAALRALIGAGRLRNEEVCVKLVGQCGQIDGRPSTEVVRHYGLEGVVDISPPVPYRQAMEMIARSHLALLLAPDQPYQIPAKAYDYLGTGIPILALAGEGATADMVRETQAGGVFAPGDLEGIKAFISNAVAQGSEKPKMNHALVRQQLDIRTVVQRLAVYCDAVFGKTPAMPKSQAAVLGDAE
jgi:glycosyltransferase involved in cell wall biosynthesis